MKPNPNRSAETNELWNWDVAEVFIGADFRDIRRYKEFEISPQGEWIDLEIDLINRSHEDGWKWNSGFEVSARIDETAHVWYGAMKIPYSAIDEIVAAAHGQYSSDQSVSEPGTGIGSAPDCVAFPDERQLSCAGTIWIAEAREEVATRVGRHSQFRQGHTIID